ncbi:hypothetical protein GY21_04660 [Cryobacterium roopkundense]|uniref:Uncharacterized protein n=1 Tax=Cryobacterium roopkundense TaxID=1001240 RepID=A0A099JPV1_9MICO|nr:hypothetical protein [Cryobacterium roopkundense]KGJ79627.1 hypothetical protein GY21_04660 [Cryobacterium roopkundense]MBB5639794.1 hypothetical protein [Cryobacterium roopkundense]
MPTRIESAQGKAGYVIVGLVFGVFAAMALAVTVEGPAASLGWGIYLLVWVGLAARTFRGDNESLAAPRAWWRMTARPPSGFVLATVFVAQAYLAITSGRRPDDGSALAVAALNALIAVAYLHSSVRLRAAAESTGAGA